MAKRKLIFVGAGDFAREMLWAATDVPESSRDWAPHAYLDDAVDAARERMRRYQVDLPVLGATHDHRPASDEVFLCGIAAPRTRLGLCEEMEQRGAEFITLIHPTAAIGPRSKVGAGSIVWRNAVISIDATLGRHVIMNYHTSAGHNAKLGDGVTLTPHCDVNGHVHLGRGVYMGTRAAVLPGLKVGDFAVLGAGTMVIRDVEPGTTIVGVPGRALEKDPKEDPNSR